MAKLRVTMIDVGWGDSIFIESHPDHGRPCFGLIDSNDSTTLRSSHLFLQRYFEQNRESISDQKPIFDFVLLSHAHADHAKGLKALMRDFGTRHFWYTKTNNKSNTFGELLRYARRSTNVGRHQKLEEVGAHQAVDDSRKLPPLGGVEMKLLWPRSGNENISKNENNNSAVLALTLGDVSFVLTGDAEEDVWDAVAKQIPKTTRLFKVPHHGSQNGTFAADHKTPVWLKQCPKKAILGISSHAMAHGHPDANVISLFKKNRRKFLRTDESYHLIFETDGKKATKKYSHSHSLTV